MEKNSYLFFIYIKKNKRSNKQDEKKSQDDLVKIIEKANS